MRQLTELELDHIAIASTACLEQNPHKFVELVNSHLAEQQFRVVLVEWSDPPTAVQAKVQEVSVKPEEPQGRLGFHRH